MVIDILICFYRNFLKRYVEDDGTIVRGEDEYGARNAKNSIVVLKTNEQKEAIQLI